MALKFKTKEEIPAEHLPLYAEREGGWVLDVDGVVDKSKVDEFRTTNVTLLKERDDLKKRFCHFAGCFHPPFRGFKPPTYFFASMSPGEHVAFHHPLLQANGEDDEKQHASYVEVGG